MTVLRSYFDESGDTDDPNVDAVSVAGAIAPIDAWHRLGEDWRSTLRDFGIEQMHMKDFAHSVGEYTGWPESRRRMLLAKLLEITSLRFKS